MKIIAPLPIRLPYGPDYMVRVSTKTARKLCAPHDLPAVGYERDIAAPVHPPSFYARPLRVQNLSGDYVVASVDMPLNRWPAVYGVTVQGAA